MATLLLAGCSTIADLRPLYIKDHYGRCHAFTKTGERFFDIACPPDKYISRNQT